jgi:hypothetical protein
VGGRLVLINSILSNMVLYKIHSSNYPKKFYNGQIVFDQDHFGKKIMRIRNINRLNGILFASLKACNL